MSVRQYGNQKLAHTELLATLTDSQGRRILRLLAGDSQAVTVRELAEKLLTVEGTNSIDVVPEETVDGVQARLRHVRLPQLAEAGLVDWDRDGGSVDSTDHPVYDDPDAHPLFEMGEAGWSAVAGEVPTGRLREVLAVLQSDGERVSRNVLAHRVAARDANGDSSGSEVDSVRTALHHGHLPRLDDAGVLDYDADDGTVTYRGTTSVDESHR